MTEVCQYIDKKNETKQKQNKANKSKTNKTSDGQSGSLLSYQSEQGFIAIKCFL